jgi:hypothetical protein
VCRVDGECRTFHNQKKAADASAISRSLLLSMGEVMRKLGARRP